MKPLSYLFCLGIGILCISGCASSERSYRALQSCELRGGDVENVCIMRPADDPYSCNQYADACVGASINVKDWCEREIAAWEESEWRNESAGAMVTYHPRPPSYCF